MFDKLKRIFKTEDVAAHDYAKMFRMFMEGKTPLDVVLEGIATPKIAERAYKEFLKMKEKAEVKKEAVIKAPKFDIPNVLALEFFIGLVLTTVDLILTGRVLGYMAGYEVNPLMAYLITSIGLAPAIITNFMLSLGVLSLLLYSSVKWLSGRWIHVPMIAYSAIRALAIIFSVRNFLLF